MADNLQKLPDEVDDPMNAFIAQEAKFYNELAKMPPAQTPNHDG